jgi:glucose/arabinose dehydrogenase
VRAGHLVAIAAAAAVALPGCGGGDGEAQAGGQGSGKSGSVKLEKLGDFKSPLYVAQAPGFDERLFVVQKAGKVRVIDHGKLRPKPFLDIHERVRSGGVEQGLLSIAFAPDFFRSGLLYVAYTDPRDNVEVVEMTATGFARATVDRNKSRHVIGFKEPAPIHNGGALVFGPDGYLYIGTGDGGPSYDPHRTAQKKHGLLGKLLRIDPRAKGDSPYTVPHSNPFVGKPGWDQIYALGLRNPWRFSFDRKTHALLIGDVGQDYWEEVDYRPAKRAAGSNFGWSAYEGNSLVHSDQRAKARGWIRPILTYRHGPGCSVTGGYVVRDRSLPTLYGRYVYGDFCSGEVRSFVPSLHKARDDRPLGLKIPALASFAEDNDGHIYAVSLNGPVYRLRAK